MDQVNDNIKKLGYTREWIDFNVLTVDTLNEQIRELDESDDDNLEHYRYRAYSNYLKRQIILNDHLIDNLFKIIKIEKDASVASAMTIDLLKRKELTDDQFERVGNFLLNTFGVDTKKYIEREIQFRNKK